MTTKTNQPNNYIEISDGEYLNYIQEVGISQAIKDAMAEYYTHRAHQREVEWDKEKDLDRIFKAARKEGWSTEAVAGTFWFSRSDLRVKAWEENYRNGGVITVPDGKPYGAFAMIANAVNNRKSD